MVDVDKAVIARLKIGGTNLEILVDSENALLFREGKDIDMSEILASDKVFFDAKKGLLASETKIEEVFQTTDINEVAKHIIKKGEVQVTADHKNKLLEQKRVRIIQMIHRNAIDPKTGNPHPVQRIELALEEAKIKIDEHKGAEQQMQEIVKKLRVVIPIKIESVTASITIPPSYAAKSYPSVKEFGSIKKEDWLRDGSWNAVIEMPAGMKNDLVDKLNSLTKGEVDIKFIGE